MSKTQEQEQVKEFSTVGDLIDHLEGLGRERALIADDDGNTHRVDSIMVDLWNPSDLESPVAIYLMGQ